RSQGKLREAESHWTRTLEISRRVYGEERGMAQWAMGWLASLYESEGRYAEVKSLLTKQVAAVEKLATPGPLNPADRSAAALGWNKLAWFLVNCPDPQLRDPAEAVAAANKAVERMARPVAGSRCCRIISDIAHRIASD